MPPRLQQILERSLKKDPRDRYQKIAEFRDDLRAVVRELPTVSGAPGDDAGVPVAPRHLNAGSPVARAFRWLKSVTSAEGSSGATFPSD